MYCQHCGAKLPENAKYCQECGKPVENINNFSNPSIDPQPNLNSLSSNQLPLPNCKPQTFAVSSKSKVAAALLAFFLGVFGIHNFYLGHIGKGVAQLLITILTCFVGTIITGIWSFIEFIFILTGSITDGDGLPLQ